MASPKSSDSDLELTYTDEAGDRLDRYLSTALSGVSRSHVKRLIVAGDVLVNGIPGKPSTRLEPGDLIQLAAPTGPTGPDKPEATPMVSFEVLHADDELIVVDKPAGLVVHPGAGHTHDTLVNGLLARYPDLAEASEDRRPGIVHRLDRDTSGVMVVARTPEAAEALKAQFKARSVEKTYLAVVSGHLPQPTAVIDAPIGRDPEHRKRMAARPDGRPAQTTYRVAATRPDFSLVVLHPNTGRTHQIRVHLTAVGAPVAGDPVYGSKSRKSRSMGRLMLHALRIGFEHPGSGERVEYAAPVPEDFRAAAQSAGFDAAALREAVG